MNLNFTSPVHPVSAPRPTSFFIEDILLHKPKPLREVPPEHFPGSLASRVPLLDYGYPLMPTPTLLAPHPHPALHKPEHHHHPYFLTTSGKCSPARREPADLVAKWPRGGDSGPAGKDKPPSPGRRGTFLHPSPRSWLRPPTGQEPPAGPPRPQPPARPRGCPGSAGFVVGERSPPRCSLSSARSPEILRVSPSLPVWFFLLLLFLFLDR